MMQTAGTKTKSIFLCAVFLILVISLPLIVYSQTLEVVNVSTPQFNELMKTYPDMMMLDIRTPGEFKQRHIEGAKNIDFTNSDFKARLNLLDKSKPALLYCRSGNRFGPALVYFEKLKFQRVYHLAAGINGGWPSR